MFGPLSLGHTAERVEGRQTRRAALNAPASERLRDGQDSNPLLAVMASALEMLLKTADDPARVKRLGQAALVAGQRGGALTLRSADPVMQSAA